MLFKTLALFVAFAISLALTPLVKKLAILIGAVDKPNERKIHQGLIPRLGGVSIYIAFILTMLLFAKITPQLQGVFLGGTVIMIVGVIDDIRELLPRYKLVGQILATLIVILYGVRVSSVTNPFDGTTHLLGWIGIPITIIWIIAIINALNLIDGLDGLASGISIIAFVVLALTSLISKSPTVLVTMCLAASTLGFLKYNFNPAKIFLGDSGSMFLGFNLGAISILGLAKGAALVSIIIPIIILGIPISDTFIAVFRRYLNKQPIFKADKGHLHHQLLALGLSQKQTVLIIYSISIIFGAVALLLTKISTIWALIIFIALTVIIGFTAGKIGLFASRSEGISNINWIEPGNKKYHKGA